MICTRVGENVQDAAYFDFILVAMQFLLFVVKAKFVLPFCHEQHTLFIF